MKITVFENSSYPLDHVSGRLELENLYVGFYYDARIENNCVICDIYVKDKEVLEKISKNRWLISVTGNTISINNLYSQDYFTSNITYIRNGFLFEENNQIIWHQCTRNILQFLENIPYVADFQVICDERNNNNLNDTLHVNVTMRTLDNLRFTINI